MPGDSSVLEDVLAPVEEDEADDQVTDPEKAQTGSRREEEQEQRYPE